MADPTHPKADRTSVTRTPRWVKVTGIAVLALILVLVLLMLGGGGDHGPGRHSGSTPPVGYASLLGLAD